MAEVAVIVRRLSVSDGLSKQIEDESGERNLFTARGLDAALHERFAEGSDAESQDRRIAFLGALLSGTRKRPELLK
uniref:hypothetical protein n=1 Tax=Azospirillum argentinense TaxID=2970906 RepID=UPI0010C0E4E7|nr:hypothetical protein [Azospirillum argentinense]